MIVGGGDLETRFGREAVRRLAGAYEAVLSSVSGGNFKELPDRDVRAAIVQAMLAEGEASGFNSARLAMVGSRVAKLKQIG